MSRAMNDGAPKAVIRETWRLHGNWTSEASNLDRPKHLPLPTPPGVGRLPEKPE
jgi:hypothetical protein